MALIVPTVMAETADEFRSALDKVLPFTRRVHVDVSDGEFAPTFLLDPAEMFWPEGTEVDIHVMVARPSEYLARIVGLRPSMIILHAESQEELLPHLDFIKQSGIKVGVALLKTTVPSTVEDLIKAADHVMVFSGDLGKFGGTASMMQLEKVRLIEKIKPGIEIGWDGGVNVENAYTLAQGGVDILNVGGVIAKSETPDEIYHTLVKEINKHGVI